MRSRFVYLVAYVLILCAVSFVPAWRALDWALFSALHQSTAPRWNDDLAIIDVPYLNDQGQFSLVEYRTRVGALMTQLAQDKQGRPVAVLFDIAFGREIEGVEQLTRGLQALAKAKVKLYAAVDPSDKPASSGSVTSLSTPLRLVDGVGHTAFKRRSGVLVYAAETKRSDGSTISALPVRVARDLFGRSEAALPEMITVRIGPRESYLQHAWKWQVHKDGDGDLVSLASGAPAQLDQRVVIVGSLDEDTNRFDGRSGPELLAWALLARMARTDEAIGPRPLDSPLMLVALLVILPGGSTLAFRTAYAKLRGRSRRMWWAAFAAVLLGVLCLGVLVAALHGLGHLYTQVTLVLFAIILAVGLACFAAFHRELLASLQADLETGKLQAAESYDVFISYSREPRNAKWVEEHVFKPLAAARHADGTPLKIFFDTRSIRLGDFWYRRLALAIAASRYFVPAYSDDYFDKAFCQHELTLALARSAQKQDFILPLLHTSRPVPPGYGHIQHIDVTAQPDFIKEVLARCAR